MGGVNRREFLGIGAGAAASLAASNRGSAAIAAGPAGGGPAGTNTGRELVVDALIAQEVKYIFRV